MSFNYGWRGPNIVKDGLVLYLDPGSPNSFYNKTDSVIKDISGNNYNGTLINGVGFNSNNGGYLTFDGTDSYIMLGTQLTAPKLFPLTSNFAWEGWLNFGAFTGNFRNIWYGHAGGGSSGFGVNLQATLNLIYCEVQGSTGGRQQKYIDITPRLNTWNQWCFSFDASNYTCSSYINGSLFSTDSFVNWGTVQTVSNTEPVYIGRYAGTIWPYNGLISSVKFYLKNLSAQEVLQNYNAIKSRFGL